MTPKCGLIILLMLVFPHIESGKFQLYLNINEVDYPFRMGRPNETRKKLLLFLHQLSNKSSPPF